MRFNELPFTIQKEYEDFKDKPYKYEIIDNVVRFKGNKIVQWLFDLGVVDLNFIWVTFKRVDTEALKEFYRFLGYSLCGYCEIFGEDI